MNKKLLLSSLISISTLSVAMSIAFNGGSKALSGFANETEEWHHYHAQNPSLDSHGKATNKGTKEYWVKCGGEHQFTVPTTGTKVYETGAPDTSEFLENDDRWSYYCDVHGHSYDSYGVCEHCNALEGATKIGDKAIASATLTNEAAPLGFKSVYMAENLSNGNNGASIDISSRTVLYFSLYHDIGSINVFGGGDTNPILWQADWYNILVTKVEGSWVAHYKKAYETSWNTDRTKVDGATDQNFSSLLRLYNWGSLASAHVKCTEVYTYVPPHVHTPDSHGICSDCKELVGGTKISDAAFSERLEPENNPNAPAGFTKVTRCTASHNSDSYIQSIDISSYTKLYLAVYASYNTNYFSGNGKSFWTNRWNYIYVEKVEGNWVAYGRDPGESEFTQLNIDNQSTNWKWLFKVICWSSASSPFTVYSTELIAL